VGLNCKEPRFRRDDSLAVFCITECEDQGFKVVGGKQENKVQDFMKEGTNY
jgi:hypothetical protein